MRVVESLNQELHDLMHADRRVIVIGEDVSDPYGGAFKVTRGLSSAFSDRVWAAPISEGGIVGVATGLAMRGWRPIVEIMFGDFLTLAMDQLLNHAGKFAWMFNHQVEVPLIVRTPMGGRRGYGPTHSQSIEKHFCGIPGLTVLAVQRYGNPAFILRQAYQARSPCLIIENKTMYSAAVEPAEKLTAESKPEVTLVAYGGAVDIAAAAKGTLAKNEEIFAEVLAIECLSPFPTDLVATAAARTGCVVAIEGGTEGWGFGSECARAIAGHGVKFASISGANSPIPSSRAWELQVLPTDQAVVDSVLRVLGLG